MRKQIFIKIVPSLVLICLFVVSVKATDIPLISQEITLTPSEIQTFNFQALSKNQIISLTAIARLNFVSTSGSNYTLGIKLNDVPVNGIIGQRVNRLMNKNSYSPITSCSSWSWFSENNWRLVYAPDFIAALNETWYEGNPYELKIDVTDLINTSSTNSLQVVNNSSSYNLVISTLKISYVSGTSPCIAASQIPVTYPPVVNNGTPGAGPVILRLAPKVGQLA